MNRETAKLMRDAAQLREAVRAKVCTCGKSRSKGEPRSGVHIFGPKTCAEERDTELVIERLEQGRCPAMHPDGDAEPVIIRFNVLSCADAACECHGKPDHGGCPTCDPDYFNRHRDPISGAFRLNAGQSATVAAPVPLALPAPVRERRAVEPTAATRAPEVVAKPQPKPARAPAPAYDAPTLSLDGVTRDGMRRYRESCALCRHTPSEHVRGGQCVRCACDAFRSNTALGTVLGLPNGQIRAGDVEIEMHLNEDGTR